MGLKLRRAQIKSYLDRIGYGGSTEKTGATLAALHRAHLFSVPFENLDIIAGQPISLDLPTIFDKIVVKRRGGFCYELNGLFGALLRGLGFSVVQLSAGVARADGGFGPEFDHLALLVGAGDAWLADVGFGDSFILPLEFVVGGAGSIDPAGLYRMDIKGKYHQVEQYSDNGEWVAAYRFTFTNYPLKAFAERCYFHQTSPESHFSRGRICSLARPDGRITLSGQKLITTTATKRVESNLKDDAEVDSVLQSEFGIVLFDTGNTVH